MSAFSKSLKALEAAEAALRIWEEERTVSAFDEASGSAERLQTDADGFSRRLEEVDALTQEPRYGTCLLLPPPQETDAGSHLCLGMKGPKMRERVKDFLTRQQRLTEALESTAAAAAASRAQLQVQAEVRDGRGGEGRGRKSAGGGASDARGTYCAEPLPFPGPKPKEHRPQAAKGAELAERIGATALAQAEDDPGRAELREAAEAARLQRKVNS
eukprot:scaffold1655_cov247-Pinguiococcus_pyrenoidosus.AAC.23